MKNLKHSTLFVTLLVSLTVSSCTVVTGIFKAGMGFGIFIVVAVVAAIVFFILRASKK